MIPSRFMLVDERSLYPVKRRVRGGGKYEKEKKPAVTLLPPDPYLIMEGPNFSRSSSPTIYRTAPPKSAKNKEASSFVILRDIISAPVQSRPESPSGRVSPFRGYGFKSPTTTHPNSRVTSPDSAKKSLLTGKSSETSRISDRPKIGKDIGLPPKSPMKSRSQNSEVKPTVMSSATPLKKIKTKNEKADTNAKSLLERRKLDIAAKSQTSKPADLTESSIENEVSQTTDQEPKSLESKQQNQGLPRASEVSRTNEKLTPVISKDKELLASPVSGTKTKTEKKELSNQESFLKKSAKPPLPPKKIGLKTTLKNESTNEIGKMNSREGSQDKTIVKGNVDKTKKKEEPSEDAKLSTLSKQIIKDSKDKEIKINSKEVESLDLRENEKKETEESKVEEVRKTEDKEGESEKPQTELEKKVGNEEKKSEKLVPCFQPDKCQIAPPTMASPSPIITPTISTPSTTADLASSSIKNSQSIAAAPTTVTSSLSSVSSTLVLTGNLARKEIENRSLSKSTSSEKTGASSFRGKEIRDSSPSGNASNRTVKAANKEESLKWSNKDSLSGEITSTTKVVKAEPDMEVLSPNNLQNSPPRMPPPNLAWDEGRLPNGDIPSKAKTETRFRRFISIVWKFLGYLFCCRCPSACKCCQRPRQDEMPKPSALSRMHCCKCKTCWNPFKCCTSGCKSECCKGKKCCRRNSKLGNSNLKSRKCCAKVRSSPSGCCSKIKARCLNAHFKLNSVCRSLFCLNLMCCQKFLRKFKFCHKFKCCQKDGFCSCCNPNVKKEQKKLNKKSSRASSNSNDNNLDVVLVEHTSLMKAAIPVLPSCLAAFCLILNLLIPGFGTFVSGVFCLCFGKPRFSVKDTPKNRVGSFILNTIIAVAQLFTVVFCLVGWGWSIWWGVIMYKLSRRQKRLKIAEKNQKEAEGTNVNQNHVDVEQG